MGGESRSKISSFRARSLARIHCLCTAGARGNSSLPPSRGSLAPAAPSPSAFHGGSTPGTSLRRGRRDTYTICELWQAPTAETALGRVLQLNAILNSLKQLRAAEWGPGRPPRGTESPETLADSCCCAQILLQEVGTENLPPSMLSIASKDRDRLCWMGEKTPAYHRNISAVCKQSNNVIIRWK